jgi:GH24 family phage-related lysozyme (muramidase)
MQQTAKHTYSFKFNKNDLKDYENKVDAKKQRGLVHYNKKGISDFMILIDEEDEVKFEKQRELLKKYLGIGGGVYIVKPKYSVAIGSVPIGGLQITQQGIDFITYHEEGKNPTLHVYNDFKSSKSKYCNEHYEYDMNNNLIGIKSGHNTHAKWSSRKCIDDSHVGIIKDKRGYGNPTIGWGHLITTEAELKRFCLTKDAKITIETANDQLQDEINEVTRQLKNVLPNISLTQCQFDALMSIVFNRGIGCERCGNGGKGKGFKGSELYKKLIGKDIEKSFETLIINDGSKLAGTVRRKNEAELFNNCKYN